MFKYKFPDIGEGITEGTLTRWLVAEGDEVKEGQDIAEIETDKMTTTLPAAASGKVHQLHVEEYGTLEVGKVFITIDDGSGEDETEVKIPVDPEPEAEETTTVDEAAGVVGELISSQDVLPPSTEGQAPAPQAKAKAKVLATPVARQLAKDLDVDIQAISGTGPAGRVMKEDIEQFAAAQSASAEQPAVAKPKQPLAASDSERREPITRIRKTIIDKMLQSKDHLVHTTLFEDIDVSSLVEFREEMKTQVGEDVKLTYLPLILKAIVLALKEFPIFNSAFDEASEEIVYKEYYNIGIATDTDRGLVVPVVFDADRKSILELAGDISELATLAKEAQLTIEQMRGGSFTITNYGAIGGSYGTPIINYPELAVLGIGRIQKKPIVKADEVVIGQMLPLSLSFDHRIIDGATGVRFIRFLEEALRDPKLLLLRS